MDTPKGNPTTITADMVAQYAYCPRRMYLMYVDGRWDDNLFTEHGRSVHQRTDKASDSLPSPTALEEGQDSEPVVSRSVMLTDEALGVTAKPDIIESENNIATPVEIKRGSVPNTPTHTYEPERIQLMTEAILLRAHDFTVTHGMVYYASSKKRVDVLFDAALEARARSLISDTRQLALSGKDGIPPPLEDSPKCDGCSLSGICLPDETRLLSDDGGRQPGTSIDIRRLYPARDDALPLYVQEQGAHIGKTGESLVVEKGGTKLGLFHLKDISQLVLCGNIFISPQCENMLCEREIPIVRLSIGNWFYGITQGHGLRNAYDRAAQFSIAADGRQSLGFAKAFVFGKTLNQRTMLRRNGVGLDPGSLDNMQRIITRIRNAPDAEALLGLEGAVAAIYFSEFNKMLQDGGPRQSFQADSRNRRPPRDPLNALLSFGYAMLAKELTVALSAEGLDPWWGFYHKPRHGRPALALDMMEEFRPLIVDSSVITAINTGRVSQSDFVISASGCAMKDTARKSFICAYEQRLDQLITHPIFNYRCSWRTTVRIQCRLLAKALRGQIKEYVGITTR